MHCLQEWSSNPHLGQVTPGGAGNSVPHCVQRETACVPGRLTGRGPKVLSRRGGGAPDFSPEVFPLSPPLSPLFSPLS